MTISQNDVSCDRLPFSDTSNSGYKQPGSTSEGCASKDGTCSGLPTSESGPNSPSVAQFDCWKMAFLTILSETASRLCGSWAPTREGSNTRTVGLQPENWGGGQPENWRAPIRELEGSNPRTGGRQPENWRERGCRFRVGKDQQITEHWITAGAIPYNQLS